MTGTDQIFLDKLKRKDTLACKQLYMQYADAMYNICLRIMQHSAEAEDALQEGFIKVFENIDQYRGESTIGSWIRQVITNTCLNAIRKKKIVWTELNESESESVDAHDGEYPHEENNGTDFSVDEIKNAIDQLPHGYKIIFNLYMFEEYSHRQIAEMLGISESTAKSQLFKAKRKLKDLLLKNNTSWMN